MDELERMLAGKIYGPSDKKLLSFRDRAHRLCVEFNALAEGEARRDAILEELLAHRYENLVLVGPIYFDYGRFTSFGKNCFANFNFTVLDCAPVTIGDNVFFGPNVTIATPVHPLLAEERNVYKNEKGLLTDKEYAKPIVIESNCWIASNVTIIGGVTIGEGSTVGAGSVVTKDVPSHSLAMGNPCRVIRKITKEDSIYLKKNLF